MPSPLVKRERKSHWSHKFRFGLNIDKILLKAQELTNRSWEYGTVAEALLELYNPELSVFYEFHPFPKGKLPRPLVADVPSLRYAKQVIRIDGETLIDGEGLYVPLRD